MTETTYPGFKTLLIGPPGTGKTFALHTLVLAGLEVFVIATDNGVETLGQFKEKVPGWTDEHQKKIHYRYFPLSTASWSNLKNMGTLLSKFGNAALQTTEDANRAQHTQILEVIDQCNNFVDQNGESFGDASTWGNDRVLVFDNTSGLNIMARLIGCGRKVLISQPDWGKIMDYEENIINQLASVHCPMVLIGHIDREVDEVSGGMVKTIGLLGRKLAPKIPRLFSDCIMARRDGSDFRWSTADSQAPELKARNLPISEKLPADFRPLVESWKKSAASMSTFLTTKKPEVAHG